MSDIDAFLKTLTSVLHEDRLSAEIESNLRAEQITKDRFLLLEDSDLKDLGFVLGPRKQLLRWIQSETACTTPIPALPRSPSPSSTPPATSDTPVPCSSTSRTPLPSSGSSGSGSTRFKNCPVDEVLSKQTAGTVKGPAVIETLKNGRMYTRPERIFLVRTVCKYMMVNCQTPDNPTQDEMRDMAQSIINTFPVLKDPLTGGYGEFYHKKHTGLLQQYVRNKRSRSATITTRWKHARPHRLDLPDGNNNEDDVRNMRERRPNAGNRKELLQLMDKTRFERRSWIEDKHPSITDILRKYPRFQDMDDAIKEEFQMMEPDCKSLLAEWQPLRSKIFSVAAKCPAAAPFLEDVNDTLEEDTKSELAFKCLIAMLPAPPKRGQKTPKLSLAALVSDFCSTFEDRTLEEALDEMRSRGQLQPGLCRIGDRLYLKADNTSIELQSASCFTEAVELLFMSFFVFNVQYPPHLRLFYGFIERLVGVKSADNSPTLRDIFRELAAVE